MSGESAAINFDRTYGRTAFKGSTRVVLGPELCPPPCHRESLCFSSRSESLLSGSPTELRFLLRFVEFGGAVICEKTGAIGTSGFVSGLRVLVAGFEVAVLPTGLSSISI